MHLPTELQQLIGRAHAVDAVSRRIKSYTWNLRPAEVGAFQISCSDESEREQLDAFKNVIVRDLLPELKLSVRSAFQLATLGGRYETGAIGIAESHYATDASATQFKVMVVKINAHVGAIETDNGPKYGHMHRYGTHSTSCGALRAMLDGSDLPCAVELRASFKSEAVDRLAVLNDPHQVHPDVQALVAAVCSSHLQLKRVLDDITALEPSTPTLFLLVNCVTINQDNADQELLCGCTLVDARGPQKEITHAGLGDDPTRLTVHHDRRGLQVTQA